MKIQYYVLLFSFFGIMACDDHQQTEAATDKKEKINPFDDDKVSKIDRAIIREYIALQDMTFDSTESGIFYSLENPGIGDPPTDNSMVTVNYELYLVDGTLMESTQTTGEPSKFEVGKVIPGWQEALKLMGVTGKGTFVIPSRLGYGLRRVNGMPPNTILVFDIELVEIVDNVIKKKH